MPTQIDKLKKIREIEIEEHEKWTTSSMFGGSEFWFPWATSHDAFEMERLAGTLESAMLQ